MGLADRLGDTAARRRRHRRVAALGIVLLVVAGVFLFLGRDDGDGDDDAGGRRGGVPSADVATTCADYGARVVRERELSFPEGAPVNDEAAAEYLGNAFADTMLELVDALRTFELDADVAAIVDALEDRIEEIEADPAAFVDVDASPLQSVAERFDAADLAACGSELFTPAE